MTGIITSASAASRHFIFDKGWRKMSIDGYLWLQPVGGDPGKPGKQCKDCAGRAESWKRLEVGTRKINPSNAWHPSLWTGAPPNGYRLCTVQAWAKDHSQAEQYDLHITHNSKRKRLNPQKPRRRSLSLLEWALVKITFARSTGILLIVSVLRSWRSYWVGECWISCFSMMVFRYNKRRVPSIRHNLSVQGSGLCF